MVKPITQVDNSVGCNVYTHRAIPLIIRVRANVATVTLPTKASKCFESEPFEQVPTTEDGSLSSVRSGSSLPHFLLTSLGSSGRAPNSQHARICNPVRSSGRKPQSVQPIT